MLNKVKYINIFMLYNIVLGKVYYFCTEFFMVLDFKVN